MHNEPNDLYRIHIADNVDASIHGGINQYVIEAILAKDELRRLFAKSFSADSCQK
jgi:hypothetical protein